MQTISPIAPKDSGADILVKSPDGEYLLVVEVKTRNQPQMVRNICSGRITITIRSIATSRSSVERTGWDWVWVKGAELARRFKNTS